MQLDAISCPELEEEPQQGQLGESKVVEIPPEAPLPKSELLHELPSVTPNGAGDMKIVTSGTTSSRVVAEVTCGAKSNSGSTTNFADNNVEFPTILHEPLLVTPSNKLSQQFAETMIDPNVP
jgi:hypothetical protein